MENIKETSNSKLQSTSEIISNIEVENEKDDVEMTYDKYIEVTDKNVINKLMQLVHMNIDDHNTNNRINLEDRYTKKFIKKYIETNEIDVFYNNVELTESDNYPLYPMFQFNIEKQYYAVRVLVSVEDLPEHPLMIEYIIVRDSQDNYKISNFGYDR